MKLSNGFKVVLLGLTLWPVLYTVLFLLVVLSPAMPDMAVIMPIHLLTMLISGAMLVFYVVHVFKTTHVDQDKKALWVIALLLGGIVAMPIYWAVHVWPENDRAVR